MAALEVAGGLRTLKRILRAEVGFFEMEILYRAGQSRAEDYLERRRADLMPGPPAVVLGQIMSMFSSEGMGDYRLESLEEGSRTAVVTTRNSFENLGSEQTGGEENRTSCSYTSGFLAGICRCVLGDESTGKEELAALETECVSQGKERCRFIIAPILELERLGHEVEFKDESASEHKLRLNDEILLRNLELQNLVLNLERKIRKRTEELKKAEEDYKLFINLSPDPVLVMGMDGSIASVNQSFVDLLGYGERREVEGGNLQDIMPGGSGAFSRLKWALEKDGAAHNFEMALETRLNGAVTVEASARIAEIDKERCIQAIFRDVTERNKLEQQLVDAKEEADLLNDLLSHDVINYASTAMHFLESVEKSQNLSDTERRNLRAVSKAVRGAYELSSVIRDSKKARLIGNKDCESKDLTSALREAIDEAKRIFSDRSVFINFEPPKIPCRVIGNALLTRLFSNLLTNAIKFDPSDEVIVDVEVVAVPDEVDYWQVRISDRGRGIPEEDRTKVFERYYRRDPSIPGTGIGLHIASQIIEVCGGSIRVESRVSGDHRKGTVIVTNLRSANGPSKS
jgi:PAS domain S-box-containing protein